ncbi:hypothetical protein, partial [Pseudomonas lundensis]|uniref:hypothetical protein n=1 Tax=Pseudomonas lundensis TaxID=86185 RepID=UPI001C527757
VELRTSTSQLNALPIFSQVGFMERLLEYQHTLDLLARWQCDTAQGYLISRPLEASALEAWLSRLEETA